jgi:hypothetical protein
MSCLPYRKIEDIKGTIKLENPDDGMLTKEDIQVIIDTLRYDIEKFSKSFKSGKSYPFDIKDWLNYRREIIMKLEIMMGD